MKKQCLLFILITLLGFASCKNKGSVDDNGNPKTLVIGMVETEKIDQIQKVREAMRKYLQKKLNMPVEMIFSNDYVGVIEALKTNKVHMAELPPFAYVIATRNMNLTPMVTLGTNGKPFTYSSVIIVNNHSKLKTMADVKAHSKELSFCFVDPASTSGHLIPRAYLNTIGLNPDSAFKQTLFAGSHQASVLSVQSGKIDVGCTTDLLFSIMIKNKLLKEGDVRVIWKSAPIVSDPIVARGDLNKDLVNRIRNAYLDMEKDDPGILAPYVKLLFHDTVKRSFMVAPDSLYDGLRKIANGVKGLKAN